MVTHTTYVPMWTVALFLQVSIPGGPLLQPVTGKEKKHGGEVERKVKLNGHFCGVHGNHINYANDVQGNQGN